MKKLKQIVQFSFVALLAAFSTTSCTSNTPPTNNDEINLNSRAIGQESYPEMYHYKTIASFAKGESIGEVPEALEAKQISLAVVYDSDAPWAEIFQTGNTKETGSYKFNQLIGTYKLSIRNQFQIDGYNECLIFDLNVSLENVKQACEDISMIDHVLVVNVKEWPSLSNTNAATAATH